MADDIYFIYKLKFYKNILLTCFGSLILLLIKGLVEHNKLSVMFYLGYMAIVLFGHFEGIVKDKFYHSVHRVCISFVSLMSVQIYFGGGIVSPVIVWSFVCQITVCFLMEKEKIFAMSFYLVGTILGACLLHSYHFQGPYFIQEPIFYFTSVILAFVTTLIIFIFFLKMMEELKMKREKLIIEKQNLLALLSHDLGNSIGLVASMANKKSLEDFGEMAYFEILSEASAISNNIIDSVKKMEAIKLGKEKKSFQKVNLGELFQKLNMLFEKKFKDKNLLFQSNVELSEVSVNSNASILLSNVLSNILSNAIKFSMAGKKIFMSAIEKNGRVHISIEDEGIGMPNSILNNLFELNIATTREGTNHESGTGFGMPLVKSSVEFLEGELQIESYDIKENPEHHGTKCTIILKSA